MQFPSKNFISSFFYIYSNTRTHIQILYSEYRISEEFFLFNSIILDANKKRCSKKTNREKKNHELPIDLNKESNRKNNNNKKYGPNREENEH
ncbi:hypothetical protein DERP_004109 [Dermatophagoides pteronyssinus]|uniref:Uncharacterized protein n=1 Tax=Dermatophagoides pteronyssinus TaxID=6956 RepID=A0ABQ8J885_DERPT|nr:hypothetical protein DERP_004109 [Dermatophagoides pteronyssinus]